MTIIGVGGLGAPSAHRARPIPPPHAGRGGDAIALRAGPGQHRLK